MNASSLHELRAAQAARNPQDERMDQVRELLIGEHVRETEARIAALAHRIDQMESTVAGQLDSLARRIEALAGETDAGRRSAFLELSRHVESLAEGIRTMAKP
jgi:hypothetical protein